MELKMYGIQILELIFLSAGSWFDLKNREIPGYLFLIFGILAIGFNMIWKYQSPQNMIRGCIPGILLLVLGILSKEAIGLGDGMGILILGILEGWTGIVLMVFLAFVFSGLYGGMKIIFMKESGKSTLPFFPFLLLGMLGGLIL